MDMGEDEDEEEDDEDGGLAMESMPWIASRVLGEAGASSLRKRISPSTDAIWKHTNAFYNHYYNSFK